MERYDHRAIESKWQTRWEQERTFAAADSAKGQHSYVLDMFPYPSAQGLHVGHVEGYSASDIYSRYLRLKGVRVLHPMGWDAFGLPAENYAIKTGRPPRETTWENIANIRRQLKSLGFSYDWAREVNTADPAYYRWTQWLFLQLYAKGLAYRKEAPVNWCPSCQTVLANEQVVDGKCERCGTLVEQRLMKQWFFKTTAYAERLSNELEGLDWPGSIVDMQRNWIGKSEGAEVNFPISIRIAANSLKECLVVHGLSGHAKENWFPWFKKELSGAGWNVKVPILPGAGHPTVEEWNKVLTQQFQADSIIVGHSIGATAALNLVQTVGKKVRKLILVAPVNPGQDWDALKQNYSDLDWDAVKEFTEIKFDWKKISELVDEIVVYYSDNDQYIPPASIQYYRDHLPQASFRFRSGRGHFNESSGVTEFPEILEEFGLSLKVFTTRLDTIFGATFMVISPELAHKWIGVGWQASSEVKKYVEKSLQGRELERLERSAKDKTGVDAGIKAINPVTNEEIPVWVADYVLGSYGTGAIMAVPAHDERDFQFAKKFGLPIARVVEPKFVSTSGEEAFRPDEEIIKRNAVCCVVRNPKDDSYLCVSWKKFTMHGFVTGGIEDGEDIVEAAKREIREETGYKNIRLVRDPKFALHSLFYHRVKKQNRWARFQYLFFELEDEARDAIDPKDEALHEVLWKPVSELRDFFSVIEGEFTLNFLKDRDYIHTGAGILWNSGEFSGLESSVAVPAIAKKIGAELKTQYRLRDWLISRQRYWGAPIPIIYCESCGEVPVPEKNLPVELPDDVDFRPTGESPLERSRSFHNVKCPRCGKEARRESDTMDTFVDSSWYFLRYCDPENDGAAFDSEKVKAWCPINFYIGGAEHAVLHLMYARFFTKALQDMGHIKFSEPFLKLRNQGLILGEDGQKMSKSKGNVVNPDEIIEKFGADTLRLYEMFMGPLEEAKPWNTASIAGVRRFLDRVWNMCLTESAEGSDDAAIDFWIAKTVKKVTGDIEEFKFNTALSAMMEYVNYLGGAKLTVASRARALALLLKLLYPFAPHLTCELWQRLGLAGDLWQQSWPEYDAAALVQTSVTIAVQVNGKLRATIKVLAEADKEAVVAAAQTSPAVAKYLASAPQKTIYVPGKLVNFVVA